MRASRPSRLATSEEDEEVEAEFRQVKVKIYAQRVRQGLPLFESNPSSLERQGINGAGGPASMAAMG